MALIQIENLT